MVWWLRWRHSSQKSINQHKIEEDVVLLFTISVTYLTMKLIVLPIWFVFDTLKPLWDDNLWTLLHDFDYVWIALNTCRSWPEAFHLGGVCYRTLTFTLSPEMKHAIGSNITIAAVAIYRRSITTTTTTMANWFFDSSIIGTFCVKIGAWSTVNLGTFCVNLVIYKALVNMIF